MTFSMVNGTQICNTGLLTSSVLKCFTSIVLFMKLRSAFEHRNACNSIDVANPICLRLLVFEILFDAAYELWGLRGNVMHLLDPFRK